MEPTTILSEKIADYLQITLDKDFGLTVHINTIAVIVIIAFAVAVFVVWKFIQRRQFSDFEIETAEFGLGDQKITFKPNDLDRTIAYQIWVELSTRKIGLKIELDDDVIDEIYNSWYEFFSVTRELIKDIPVNKVRNNSTRQIIQLSIEVLNEGLRPHLTRWQARFRRWYSYQLAKDHEAALHPQDIQRQFPAYDDLVADMLDVNDRLIAYRIKMYEIVTQNA